MYTYINTYVHTEIHTDACINTYVCKEENWYACGTADNMKYTLNGSYICS